MGVCQRCGFTAAWSAVDEAFFYKERFIDFFESSDVFAYRRSYCSGSYRSAAEFFYDRGQYLVVDGVQAAFVDVQGVEGDAGDGKVDAAAALHLGEVPDATQQTVGDSGRAAAAHSYFAGCIVVYAYAEYLSAAYYNIREHVAVVIFKVFLDAEAGGWSLR